MIIKYTKAKYVDDMLNEGKVRISTFWHFSAHEQAEIGDPDEGQTRYAFRNDTEELWVLEPELLDAAALSVEGQPRHTEAKTLIPGDESWIEAAGGFNTFMYSLTEADSPSRSQMTRLDPEYDTAVEVIDLHGFANHTGSALQLLVNREFGFSDLGYT